MKLAVLCSSFVVGGAENMVAQLIHVLDKKYFDTIIITSNPKEKNHIQKLVDDSGAKCYVANSSKRKGLVTRLKTFFTINKILKKEKPDIIHTNLSIVVYVLPYVFFHRVRFIHTVHNLPEKDLGRAERKILRFFAKINKVRFASISKEIQKKIKLEYGVSDERAPIIFNPVFCSKYSFCEKMRKSSFRGVLRFINVGRLSKQKNQSLLIKAFRGVVDVYPSSKLSIVGEGELLQDLYRLIEELNLENNVSLLGMRADVPALFAQNDVFVLSSDYEGLPLTILEAEAASLPIVSTNVGGISDIVENEKNGLLVSPNDETALTEAMISMNDESLRMNFGKKSKEIAMPFDVNVFVQKYSKLYREELK